MLPHEYYHFCVRFVGIFSHYQESRFDMNTQLELNLNVWNISSDDERP